MKLQLLEITFLSTEQKAAVYKLWNNEYPENLKYTAMADFDIYLNNLSNTIHYIVTKQNKPISGWGFVFDRNNERWFAILLDSKIQKQYHGTWLLNKLKEKEDELNGWVIDHNHLLKQNGEVYSSPLEFYTKNGFIIQPSMRLETGKISAVKIRWRK